MAQQSSLLSIIGTSGVLLVGSRYCPLCPARAVVVRRSLGFTRTAGAHTFFIRELNPRDRLFGKGSGQRGVRPCDFGILTGEGISPWNCIMISLSNLYRDQARPDR